MVVVGRLLKPAYEVAFIFPDPTEQLVLEVTRVKQEDIVLHPGSDAHGFYISGLAGVDGCALRVAGDPDDGMYLELGLASRPGKLFGQFIVQPDNGAVCHLGGALMVKTIPLFDLSGFPFCRENEVTHFCFSTLSLLTEEDPEVLRRFLEHIGL